MQMREVREIARSMGVRTKGKDRTELIRAIQRAEGNFDCFATAARGECDQENCLWRDDCFAESAALEMAV